MPRSAIHHDSVEYLHVAVTVPADVVITAQPVEFALVAGTPGEDDWQPAEWLPGTTTARMLVGPFAASGLLNVWVRVTDSPEIPVLKAGSITIT